MNIPSDNSVFKIVTYDGMEALNLQPEEAFVLSRVNGTDTIKQISKVLGYDVEKVWKTLARLVENGFVQVVEGKRPSKGAKPLRKSESILDVLDKDEQNVHLRKVPREKRKEILLMYDLLKSANHYEFFGLKNSASTESIKKVYFLMVKKFHPDRFFDQKVGHYHDKLEVIFGRITEVFEIFTDSLARKKYDRSLKAEVEKKLVSAKSRAKDGEKEPVRRTPATLIERLASAKRYFEMGKNEESIGNHLKAASFYQMAQQYDPKNKEIHKAFERMKPTIERRKADDVFSRGMDALNRGDRSSATALLEEVLQLNPRKKECYRELAMLYMERKSSLRRAKEMGLKAVELYQNNAQVHAVMGKIHMTLGEKKMAKKAFNLSLKFDHENKLAGQGLRDLKD